MQKSFHKELATMLVKYHRIFSDDAMMDRVREKRLRKLRKSMSVFDKADVRDVASRLSSQEKRGVLFRLWCELVSLTGEV